MSDKLKDIDYLFISARVKAMENGLLGRERMEQIMEARSDEEAVKLLQESGYPEFSASKPEEMDAALSAVREETLADLLGCAPDPRYLDIFKLKYDYHNVKAILKAEAMGVDSDRMLTDLGRIPAQALKEAVKNSDFTELPPLLASAVLEAREVLGTTRDPQLSDIVLDRWSYRDMADVAERTDSSFLRGYVRAVIDAANLRTLVRTLRMGKNADFFKGVLLEGGDIGGAEILAVSAANGGGLVELYAPTELRGAAEAGAAALAGGPLTEFEKLCDDAVSDYLAGAKYVAFGEAPLVGYLAARETEYMNLRILLTGRASGLPPEVIRSRLRESYV